LSPAWHLGTAIRYAESIGYKGFYTIEVSEDPAVRVIYSAILGGLALRAGDPERPNRKRQTCAVRPDVIERPRPPAACPP